MHGQKLQHCAYRGHGGTGIDELPQCLVVTAARHGDKGIRFLMSAKAVVVVQCEPRAQLPAMLRC